MLMSLKLLLTQLWCIETAGKTPDLDLIFEGKTVNISSLDKEVVVIHLRNTIKMSYQCRNKVLVL